MSAPVRFPISVPVPPNLFDHRVVDRPVLPAAHALCLLADSVKEQAGTACPRSQDASFGGFLYLPDRPGTLSAFVELREEAPESFSASLLSRIVSRSSRATRMKEHIRARFSPSGPAPALPPETARGFCTLPFPVPAEALYRDLVPFGPAFRNLAGDVLLFPEGVSARITAPAGSPLCPVLGSPFVFDAALHAVNAWIQRYRGIVAFPVGYAERHVPEPAREGGTYLCTAIPGRSDGPAQEFDLWILSPEGRLNEAILGVRMRELFPGRLRPPGWIRS